MLQHVGISFLFTAEQYYIVRVHILLIHSAAEGPWGCFHVLAIVSNAAVSVVDECPRGSAFGYFGNTLEVRYVVTLFPGFWRNLHTVSHSGCTIYIPSSSALGLQLLYILANTCFLGFFFW